MISVTKYIILDLIKTIGLLALIITVAIVIICELKKQKLKQLIKPVCVITMLILFAISGISYFIGYDDYVYDLKNEAYVIYYGGYEIIAHSGGSRSMPTAILYNTDKKVFCNSTAGEYYGYLIYLEKSEVVIYKGETLDGFNPKEIFR